MSQYLEKYVSNLVADQFPSFYHSEGPLFIEFLRIYMEWMESVSQSRDDDWISEGISYLTIESGNTSVVGTNTRLTNYFADGDKIAISRGENSDSYDVFTINSIANNTSFTLTTEPIFSEPRCKFTTVSNTGNPVFMVRHFDEIRDIDDTFENFLVYFKEKYLKNLQFINVTNTRNLVKHSLDLYRSKGTERGIELLFRIAFGITPSVYYPSSDLFKLSDGRWHVPLYLEVSLNDNTPTFVGKQIIGMTSGATAFAESVIRRSVKSKLIDVIYISSVNGYFMTGEPINIEEAPIDALLCPFVTGSLTVVEVDSKGVGSGFEIGEELTVSSDKGEEGIVRVHETINVSGAVQFTLIDGGYGYSADFDTIISDKVISVANVVLSNGDSPYFEYGDMIIEPMADISYEDANGNFTEFETIFTYHANNDLKGSGKIMTNGTLDSNSGILRVSILSGNMDSSVIYTESNAVSANVASYADQTATGNVVGVLNSLTLSLSNATGTFSNGDVIFQYDSNNIITATATVSGLGLSSFAGDMTIENSDGTFHSGSLIYTSSNLVSANVLSCLIKVGVTLNGANDFSNVGNPYLYSPNSTSNGLCVLVPFGDGASVNVSTTLLYPETITILDEPIYPYLSVELDAVAYGFVGNASANLTNITIDEALSSNTFQIGKLSHLITQSGGAEYTESPIIKVIDSHISPYKIGDMFVVEISGTTTSFGVNEYVYQEDTGARGIVISANSSHLLLERLNFDLANTWIETVNATTQIVGLNTGAAANVETVYSISEEFLGENAEIETHLNIGNNSIKALQVIQSGFGFVHGETVTLSRTGHDPLQGTAHLINYGFGKGFYLDQGGFASEQKKLFDGDYFQYFSYEVRSSKTLDQYMQMLKEVMHVAGTKVFGAFYHNADVLVETSITTSVQKDS